MKYVYNIYNRIIKSPFSLDLDQIESTDFDIEVIESKDKINNSNIFWFHSNNANGRPWLSYGKNEGNYFLSFHSIADFSINQNCSKIVFYSKKSLELNQFKHIFIDQVLPRALTICNNFLLHASSVGIDDKAIVFIGSSGTGKSTLAAYFCLNGYELIADDALLLKKENNYFQSIPSYSGIRLLPDTIKKLFKNKANQNIPKNCNSKEKIVLKENNFIFSKNQKKINTIYIVNSSKTFSIHKINSLDIYKEITRNVIRFDITNNSSNIDQFSFTNDIINKVDIYMINYSKNLNSLDKILAHARKIL